MSTGSEFAEVLAWCAAALGPTEVLADHSRQHAGMRAAAQRLRTPAGECFLKIHRDPAHWHSEVHGYEQWAGAFGRFAPRLLAVRDAEPLALVIGALPGRVLEDVRLDPGVERGAWRAAGQALAGLHSLPAGAFFGACRRDGSPASRAEVKARAVTSAPVFLQAEIEDLLARGARTGCLGEVERTAVRASLRLLPAFSGERPSPCHRDYCPPNWLVSAAGEWMGVIDFEFSAWDVRATDFTRLPNWEWLHRSDLLEAFYGGYASGRGSPLTPLERQQILFCQCRYALGALVWGMENDYRVFAQGGREALAHLAKVL